jgi:myo-inositol-1-phosphate synthase
LAALRRGLIDETSMVTALPLFDGVDLEPLANFVVGGHDVRRGSFLESVRELHQRAGVFDSDIISQCEPDLEEWDANLRPGTVLGAGSTISKMADLAESKREGTAREAIAQVQQDLRAFKDRCRLDEVVVAHVGSTEPPFPLTEAHQSLEALTPLLDKTPSPLPASSLYAFAALDLGHPYVNFTPSLGASCPALLELAQKRRTVVAGQDGKTGETLLKTVLAPMFAARNWQILSWVGHNIFGNRDGLVLDNPENKASKIRTKDQVISQIVGYKPQTHVSIEYIQSLDDWKTAWDHIHFRGFLNTKMTLQFIWQGCDSLLAAPLLLDLARLALLSHRRGEVGILRHLACFFKNPQGIQEHDFFLQMNMLEEYLAKIRQ